jgi:hypothetical protein
MTHPNESLVRRLYEARERRDETAIREILAPGVVWRDPYPPPFGGEFRGVDAVFEGLFRAIETDLDGSGLELHDVLANDEHVVALVDWWALRHGVRMEGTEVGIYHVRGGQVVEVAFLTSDQRASDAFFS